MHYSFCGLAALQFGIPVSAYIFLSKNRKLCEKSPSTDNACVYCASSTNLFLGTFKIICWYYGLFLMLFPSQLMSKSFPEKAMTMLMTLVSTVSTVSEYIFTFPQSDCFKGCLLFFPDGRSHLSSVVRTSLVWMVAGASLRPGEPTAAASQVSLEESKCYFSAKELVLWFSHPWDSWKGSNVSSSYISVCQLLQNCKPGVILRRGGLGMILLTWPISQYGMLLSISFTSWGFVNCAREPYWVRSSRNDKRRIGAKG